MTYQELKARLTKCEYTLNCIKDGSIEEKGKKTIKNLELLKESLQAQLLEQEGGTVVTKDSEEAEKLAKKGVNVNLKTEGPYQTTYIKVSKSDYKKAISILDSNIDPTYAKMDVVDDDGDDNVIIYFNFRTKDDGEPGEDPAEFIYDLSMDLEANGISVVDKSHDVDESRYTKIRDYYRKIDKLKGNQFSKEKEEENPRKPSKQIDELDINDPVFMKLRALKTKIGRKKGIVKGGERLTGRKRELLAKLKAKRAQVMTDMENDPSIEPEGGPVADMYGDQLNRIDKGIEKASGNKPKSYDDTFNESQDDIFALGYDLDATQYLVDYLKSKYKEGQDYELHIGRGDTHPNAVTLINPEMEQDEELGNLLMNAGDNEETDYQSGREAEKDYIGEKKRPGLWANIRAKRARGEKPAHKNSNAHKDAVKAGQKINKDEGLDVNLSKEHLSIIASKAGKAIVQAVHASGDEVSSAKIKKVFSSALSPSTPEAFTVHIIYKNDAEVSYRFQIEGENLVFLADGEDIILSDVGLKPSGEPFINSELVRNEMTKYFKQMREMNDKEFSDAQESDRLENHPEKDKILAIQNLIAREKGLKEQTVAIDLSWEGFQEKFPQVKDENLAGEVYDIMQDQGSFDDMDDEDVIEFINAASTWTDAEDVADYFDEPASDIGKLIAGYYQTESGYEDYDDKWYNYLDYLFPQTEREGDDIDDYYIDEDIAEEYTKEKLLAYLGQADDAMIRTYDDKYLIIYNPKNGNDDNAAMWHDDTVFGVDQDGEEHEVRYNQIDGLQLEDINEESELDKVTKAKRLIKQQAPAMNKLPQDDPKRIAFINQVKQINTKHKQLLAKQDDKIAGTGRDQELDEGRGDFDDVLKAVENMANNDDISERDAAAEIVLALADKFQLPVDKNLEDYMEEGDLYEIKVGDTLTKDGKKGKVTKLSDITLNNKTVRFATVDFGNGDVDGIAHSRIKGSEIAKEEDTNEYGSSQGARELETLFGALGYDEFDDFIEDNPGAVEALHGWISSIPEFRKKLGAEFSNSELEDMGMYDIAGYDDEDGDMDEAEAKPVPPQIMRGYNVNVKNAQTMAQALLSLFNQINSKEQADFSKNSSIKRVLNLLNTISKTKDTESEQPEV